MRPIAIAVTAGCILTGQMLVGVAHRDDVIENHVASSGSSGGGSESKFGNADSQVLPVPVATFGGDANEPLVNVTGAALIGDTVVIADNTSGSLRYYDLSGRLLKAVGRRGDRPGEFENVMRLQYAQGLLKVYDGDLRRLSEFDLTGRFVRMETLEGIGSAINTEVLGVFSDRTVCVEAITQVGGSQSAAVEVRRKPAMLLRFTPTGALVDTIGSVKLSETLVVPNSKGGQRMGPVAFGRVAAAVVNGDRVYTIENDFDSIFVFDKAGGRRRAITPGSGSPRVAITRDDIRIARAQFLARFATTPLRDGSEQFFDAMPVPKYFPPYGWAGERRLIMMRAMTTGELWVLPFGGIRTHQPVWTVYDRQGRLRHHVRSSTEVDVLDARADVAIVRAWDSKNVERIELRRIQTTP